MGTIWTINWRVPRSSEIVSLKNGFYNFRAQIDYHHTVDPGTSCCSSKGTRRPIRIPNEDAQSVTRAIDEIFNLTALACVHLPTILR